MGIEHIAKRMSSYKNQRLATAAQPCVRNRLTLSVKGLLSNVMR